MAESTKPPSVPVVAPVEPPPAASTGGGDSGPIFCTEYVNRWGKRMVAAEYGYKAWCFRDRTGRKSKP